MDEAPRFRPLFECWARAVRSRLLLRRALTGGTVGLALAVLPALAAWKTGHGALRPFCAGGALLGAAVGVVVARRKRWSDEDVALWLDDRLETDEAITTAVEIPDAPGLTHGTGEPTHVMVVSTAATALARADEKRARPAVLRPLHALAPLALAAFVFVLRSPVPVPVVPAQSPRQARVQRNEVEGLRKAAELGRATTARDDAQKQRLEDIAKDAEKLEVDLHEGLEKRAALDRIARLRDAIAAERLTLGEGERRAGLEAAVSKLEQSEATREAAKALGDHDLETMDREMERIANAREKQDRASAKRALEGAAAAARAAGAPDVAQALAEEKKALAERERRAELLRDLAQAMGDSGLESPEQKSEADALDRKGSDATARSLADATGKALEKLTPEERKKLAAKLRERATSPGGRGSAARPEDLKDLGDALSTPEGQKKLENELKELADEDDESPESRGQRDLDDAERGADGTEGDMNGAPGEGKDDGGAPGEGHARGPGSEGEKGPPPGSPGAGSGGGKMPIVLPGLPGPGTGTAGDEGATGPGHHDTGTAPHDGKTGALRAAGTLKSRAHAPMNAAPGMPGTTTGWTPGKAGGTANVRGTGALGAAGPAEVDGVDRSEVPEEYREQVRQYFHP
jgi:hypothetical protein